VFISSTMRDLQAERDTIDKAISELHFEALRAETIGAQSVSPEEACLMMAQECDIYLGILGARYGTVPPGETISVTEMEFDEAKAHGKPMLVYRKLVDEYEPPQQEFVERIGHFKKGLKRRDFSQSDLPEPLSAWIKEDVARLVTNVWRAQLVDTPGPGPRGVLLASLGKAPGAVTGLYHALTERGISIDKVVTISPKSPSVRRCVTLLQKEFGKRNVEYQPIYIDAEDIRYESDAFEFKSAFNTALQEHDRPENDVYLGIAGGRTSMGALMAIVAQMSAPHAYLYHLWVPDDIEADGAIARLFALSPARQQEVLFPQEYELVKVPFVRHAHEPGE
jgi:hypothetical protein